MPKSAPAAARSTDRGRLTESMPILLSAAGKPPLAMAVSCRNIDAGGRSDRHRWRLIRKILDQGCQFGTDDRSPEPKKPRRHPLHRVGVVRERCNRLIRCDRSLERQSHDRMGVPRSSVGASRVGPLRCRRPWRTGRAFHQSILEATSLFPDTFLSSQRAIERQWQIRSKRGVLPGRRGVESGAHLPANRK